MAIFDMEGYSNPDTIMPSFMVCALVPPCSMQTSSWRLRGRGGRAVLIKAVWVHTQTRVEAIRLAQAHYPERLALAVVCHPPMLFWALWRSVQPFLDPMTKCACLYPPRLKSLPDDQADRVIRRITCMHAAKGDAAHVAAHA